MNSTSAEYTFARETQPPRRPSASAAAVGSGLQPLSLACECRGVPFLELHWDKLKAEYVASAMRAVRRAEEAALSGSGCAPGRAARCAPRCGNSRSPVFCSSIRSVSVRLSVCVCKIIYECV